MADTADQIHARLQERVRQFAAGLEPVVGEVVDLLAAEMRRQAGLTDHTLKQLAKMGHPYKRHDYMGVPEHLRRGARTWTSKGLFRRGIPRGPRLRRELGLGHDIKLVHAQSGTLFNHIYTALRTPPNRLIGVVGVDPAEVPYLPYVVQGTRYMIPRDFIGRAAVIAKPRCFAAMRSGVNALARSLGMR